MRRYEVSGLKRRCSAPVVIRDLPLYPRCLWQDVRFCGARGPIGAIEPLVRDCCEEAGREAD